MLSSRAWASLAAAMLIAAFGTPASSEQSDWPCIQHKVDKLTSVQMWDGPPVDDIRDWRNDAEIAKLIPVLTSRRVPLEKTTEVIESFAASRPQENRDEALKLLFAGVLETANRDRAVVMGGIERFQRRQRARAAEIETQSAELRNLRQKGEAARAELAAAEEKYNWDVRVFAERQQSIPLACEIPVLIEQRLFAIAREIRAHMAD